MVFTELLTALDTPIFYPQHKAEAGPHFWGTLHNVASMYPDKPSPIVKKEMKTFLKRWVKGFPCSKCQRHGVDYMRTNRPALKSRASFLSWTEDFHNWVNENLHKSQYTIEFDKHRKCPGCNAKVERAEPSRRDVPPLPGRRPLMEDYAYAMDTEKRADLAQDSVPAPVKDEVEDEIQTIDAEARDDLPNSDDEPDGDMEVAEDTTPIAVDASGTERSFDKVRDAYEGIMYELCDAAGIPKGKVRMHFHTCPDIPDKSCTKAVVGDRAEGYIDVYVDPMSGSPRSIVHEFYHVQRAYKGDIEGFKDEAAAEEFARPIIHRHFPYDPVTARDTTGMAITTAKDTMMTMTTGSYFPYSPRFSETLKAERMPRHTGDEIVHDTTAGGGFASVFERAIPADIEKFTGMDASVITDAAAPEIVGYTTNAVQDIILSPFGVALTSVIGGMGLFGASIALGDSLPFRDKKLLFEYGNHMFWSFIRYANPGANQQVYAGANAAGQALSRLDFAGAVNTLLKTSTVAAVPVQAKPVTTANAEPEKPHSSPPPPPYQGTNFALGSEDTGYSSNTAGGIYNTTGPVTTNFAIRENDE